MHPEQKLAIREALATLASTHSVVVEQIERTVKVLNEALASENLASGSQLRSRSPQSVPPMADRDNLSVNWKGKSCFLGNTLLFWFFERISRSPNRYVTYVDLLDDVWGGQRDNATIRGVVKRLRDRLVESEMKDLADSIDGSVSGHYGLILV